MIEQDFNYTDFIIKEMTDFFETRAENLKPKEDKKKCSATAKKPKNKKSTKKKKLVDSDSSVVKSSEDQPRSTVFYRENTVILRTNSNIYML